MSAPESLATAAEHLTAAKMFSLASCVMLFYDMVITFGDEVEKIWKQRFTGATILWFMNRYLSPLGYVVIIVSFHDPWPKSVCQRYVLYPEILKIFTATAIGIIFILRLYSIYSRNQVILVAFTLLLLMELSVKIWAFTDGTMLELPPQLIGCILTGKSDSSKRIVYTWVAELVFDTLVFIATLYRTLALYRTSGLGSSSSLIRIIMRDGVIYFAAIFFTNLVTVLMFVAAPPDLKVINASFSTLITSLMVSRLMLNLRQEAIRRSPVRFSTVSSGPIGAQSSYGNATHSLQGSGGRLSTPASSLFTWVSGGKVSEHEAARTFEQSIIGNLGAPVGGWFDDDDEEHIGRDEHKKYTRRDNSRGRVRGPEDGMELGVIDLGRKGSIARGVIGGTATPIAVEVTQEVVIHGDVAARDSKVDMVDDASWKKGEDFLSLE